MNLAIIYGEMTRVKHIESEIIRIYAEGAAYTILNIVLQKHPPSRHRSNYYACGHRGLRTNNPELRIGREGRGGRGIERELETHTSLLHMCVSHRESQTNLIGKFHTSLI